MKIGLQIPSFTWDGGIGQLATTLAEIARTADDAGFASIWVMDHFFQIQGVGEYDEPMLEGYATLCYLAAATKTARLGTMVTGANYRDPGFLVKTVTTLDVLSGGRAWLGVGAGWFEREALGLGLPFPPLKERFERLEETLQIVTQMWSGDFSPYTGEHYHLAEPLNSPQPLSQPHPPILIGGMGEKKTLRMVAQYADACNLFAFADHDVLRHKLNVLKEHCETLGRDYNEIEKTALAPINIGLDGSGVAETIANCQSWSELGIQHVIFSAVPNVDKITPIEIIGREIIPAVADM